MRNDIVGLAQQYAQQRVQSAVRRIAAPAGFGVVAAVFFLIVVVALFAALFFWVFCFGMSRYSQMIERRLARGDRR